VTQLSLLPAAPKPKPRICARAQSSARAETSVPPIEPPKVVCKCAGQLVEVDEDGVWCITCGRRKP
jgi:hypothetical protein